MRKAKLSILLFTLPLLLWALTGCHQFEYCPEEEPAKLWDKNDGRPVEPDGYFFSKRQANQNELNMLMKTRETKKTRSRIDYFDEDNNQLGIYGREVYNRY